MALRRWPEATASKKQVLEDKFSSEDLPMGSKGGSARARRTLGKLHEGSKRLDGGRLRIKAQKSLDKTEALEIEEPSENLYEWIRWQIGSP